MAENKGAWIDSKTGKVVTSQPEEGVQLMSPNVEAGPEEEAAVEAAKTVAAGGSEPQTVTTKATKK